MFGGELAGEVRAKLGRARNVMAITAYPGAYCLGGFLRKLKSAHSR